MSKNSKWYLAGVGLVGVVVGVALVAVGNSTLHWAGSNEFCGSFCHSMDNVRVAYEKGQHFQTKSGFTVNCVECHNLYKSDRHYAFSHVIGGLIHKAEAGFSSLSGEIRGTLKTPEMQVAKQAELGKKVHDWMKEVNFQPCRGCHDLANMAPNPQKPMIPTMHKNMASNPKTDCLLCHKTAGHKYN